jgi:hypothetical protein
MLSPQYLALYNNSSFYYHVGKLQELRPQDDLKATDARLRRHKLRQLHFIQICHPPVKENLWV